jgi:hypothetical protein
MVAHFPDFAVSTTLAALTIWTSTDGENGIRADELAVGLDG